MSSKIIYSVTVVPIQDTTLEGKTFEAVESDVGKALSGANNALTWAGNSVADWTSGVHDHKTSNGGTIAGAGTDGLWLKHTGYKYDVGESGNIDRATANTDTLDLIAGGVVFSQLKAGEGIFLPLCAVTITLDDEEGDPIAVEYAIFT